MLRIVTNHARGFKHPGGRKLLQDDREVPRISRLHARSSRNIDQHDLKPVSEGGAHTLENLITLCESHHDRAARWLARDRGDASGAKFVRRPQSGFAVAQRTVETASALKSLGFDKHEVRVAIERTRTHVGMVALSLEQWIKIALSYCPKQSSWSR